MDNLSIREIAAAVKGRLVSGNPDAVASGVSTDARTIAPGELFFALKGERFDGHVFVPDAFAKGAAAAVVSNIPEDLLARGFAIIQVPDTLVALGDLAAHHRRRFAIPVVAVTGSVGKTTAKEMTARVLDQRFRVLKNEGNLNNEIGVPKTLFALSEEHQAAVLELAMRAKGEIRRLAEISRPTHALITNIGLSHVGILGSQQAIAEAKAEVLEFLQPPGRAILNADDDYFRFLADRSPAPVISFGIDRPADVGARRIEATEAPGVRFLLSCAEGEVPVELAAPGLHNVRNALSAAAVGLALGMDLAAIKAGLESFSPGAMRMEIRQIGDVRVLVDCYNASPASMEASLEVLRSLPRTGRRIAVLGDMKELGHEAEGAHRRVGSIAADIVEILMTVGELGRLIAEGARNAGMSGERIRSFQDNQEAAAALQRLLRPGDAVLIKGSRAMQMEEIVSALEGQGTV